MPLEFRRYSDGRLRPSWFGSYEINGKRYCDNLGVKIAGTPPSSQSLRDEGDAAFERSRATALAKLNNFMDEARQKRGAERQMEKLYEIKTGEAIQAVTLSDLPDEWLKIPRKRKPNERYAKQCQSTLGRFTAFVKNQNPNAQEIGHVTRSVARAFMQAEDTRGVTAKTWNDTLKLLRATFKHLMPVGAINPFVGIPTRDTEIIFRHPFTPDELKAILDAASLDDFIRPVIIVGICTAMRRGDCCQLKWKDVDLKKRFITVKTSKTGQTVSIPIFAMLYDELCRWKPSSEYVFPEQAEMYRVNSDGITWRVRKIFADAGFKDPKKDDEGKSEEVRGEIHAARKGGLRRASVRDFHSFRVTWVTLALTGGIPMELVQKVTGHKTIEIVLKHYFQPGQEDFRLALQNAMPQLLTNGDSRTPKDQMLEILDRSTTRTWKDDTAQLRELIASL